jgi:hypothetical protein
VQDVYDTVDYLASLGKAKTAADLQIPAALLTNGVQDVYDTVDYLISRANSRPLTL